MIKDESAENQLTTHGKIKNKMKEKNGQIETD